MTDHNREDVENMLMVLAALVAREGGQISMEVAEVEKQGDLMMLYNQTDLPGFIKITLIPEYVAIGELPPDSGTISMLDSGTISMDDDIVAKVLEQIRVIDATDVIDTNVTWASGQLTRTSNASA